MVQAGTLGSVKINQRFYIVLLCYLFYLIIQYTFLNLNVTR